jgi:hypothetical protein
MICTTLLGGKDESLQNAKNTLGIPISLRFFILLDNDDYLQKSCWFSYSKLDYILQNLHLFPGKLDVYSLDQYKNSIHRFLFVDNCFPKKNRVYVRIPKEKKYVLLEDFTKYWVLSQLNELNILFLRLNAENVKIKHYSESGIKHSLVGIHPGIDEYINSMGVKDHESVEIRYSFPKKTSFNISNYVYYEKWKNIVERRINEGICYDEYYFKYEKPDFLNESFIHSLRTWGLIYESTCELSYTDISNNLDKTNFELHYEIFYYPDEMI